MKGAAAVTWLQHWRPEACCSQIVRYCCIRAIAVQSYCRHDRPWPVGIDQRGDLAKARHISDWGRVPGRQSRASSHPRSHCLRTRKLIANRKRRLTEAGANRRHP
jgi:hypothetical protein